ncbi:MAG TPA: hypothetical protein VGN34_24260, partial [Ktedonobacteraceae bacterium]
SHWKFRRGLVLSFGFTMALLLIGAERILPGWIPEFRAALAAYRQYTGNSESIVSMFSSPGWGIALTILIVLGLGIACWRGRREVADTPLFALTSSLVLATTLVIIPTTALYNQVLLMPAIFLLVQRRRSFLTGHPALRLAAVTAALALFWPWLTAMPLACASLVLPAASVQKAWTLPLWTTFAIPPLIAVLLASLVVSRSSDAALAHLSVLRPDAERLS